MCKRGFVRVCGVFLGRKTMGEEEGLKKTNMREFKREGELKLPLVAGAERWPFGAPLRVGGPAERRFNFFFLKVRENFQCKYVLICF